MPEDDLCELNNLMRSSDIVAFKSFLDSNNLNLDGDLSFMRRCLLAEIFFNQQLAEKNECVSCKH